MFPPFPSHSIPSAGDISMRLIDEYVLDQMIRQGNNNLRRLTDRRGPRSDLYAVQAILTRACLAELELERSRRAACGNWMIEGRWMPSNVFCFCYAPERCMESEKKGYVSVTRNLSDKNVVFDVQKAA